MLDISTSDPAEPLASTPPGESDIPYPPRFRWLKRLSIAGLVLVAALLVLRAWWGQSAREMLAAEHARLRAAGHPATPQDLDAVPLPAGQNAAEFIRQAIAANNPNTGGPSTTALTFPAFPPYPKPWHQLATRAVTANAGVFPPLRQARAVKGVDWNLKVRSPAFTVLLPMLNQSRSLANLAGDAALRAHTRGDDAAGLELVRDVRNVAWVVDHQPILVSHLVAVGCDALALNRLQVIASDLRVVPGGDVPVGSPVPRGPATRGQVQALIGELLSPPPPGAGLGRSLAGERIFAADLLNWAATGNPAVLPLMEMEQRRMLLDTDWYIAAATQQTATGARAVLASQRQSPPRGGPVRMSTALSNVLAPSLNGVLEQELRVLMERRLTALLLAVRLYYADHGDWPASAQALVPEYLPALPADPFAPAGQPLGYVLVRGGLPSGGDRPLVYSVGSDGIDETAASTAPLPNVTAQYGWANGTEQRRDVSRWRRPAPPAPPPPAALGQPSTAGKTSGESVKPDDAEGDVTETPDDAAANPSDKPSAETVEGEPDVADNPGEAE